MQLEELKSKINLHDLAIALGMKRAKSGNYLATWRDDQTASVSIFTKRNGQQWWKDHGSKLQGSAIDLIMQCEGVDTATAIARLKEICGIHDEVKPRKLESQIEYLWRIAREHKDISVAVDYLTTVRCLPVDYCQQVKGKAYGYTDYRPSDNAEHYGPAVVFPILNQNGEVKALSLRYIEPDHNPRMRIVGSAEDGLYTVRWSLLQRAIGPVWLVESPIDALTLSAAGCIAVAFISSSLAESFPLSWVNGIDRLIIFPDHDNAGSQAAYSIYHRALTEAKTAQIVDLDGFTHKDPNDAIKDGMHLDELKKRAHTCNSSLFPIEPPWLPELEYKFLPTYRCYVDHMETVKVSVDETGAKRNETIPVAGFRVYRIDPITVYDPVTAVGGIAAGYSANKALVIYRRVDSPHIQRTILDSKDIGKTETWKGLGWIHHSYMLARILQTLSRDQRRSHETVNVIGLINMGKRIQLNDTKNTYLNHDQCIYHRLIIPTNSQHKAKQQLLSLMNLFIDQKAVIAFTWLAGSLLKVFTGFWPHLIISAHSGSGKTTLIESLHHLTGALAIEPSELETSFRRMRILGNHLYPVLLDECSRANPKDLTEFLNMLNVSYRYALRHHGRENVFLLAAPVAMIGQDSPNDDAAFITKIIQFDLDHSKGEIHRFNEPFPMREFALWLASRLNNDMVTDKIKLNSSLLKDKIKSNASIQNENVSRLVDNYAAIMLAHSELCEFADFDNPTFTRIIVDTVIQHLSDTSMSRRESVAILDRLAREMAIDNKCPVPFRVEDEDIILPPSTILDYLNARGHHFPVTSTRRLIDHLKYDGFLVERGLQRSIGGIKYSNCIRLSIRKMLDASINWPTPE